MSAPDRFRPASLANPLKLARSLLLQGREEEALRAVIGALGARGAALSEADSEGYLFAHHAAFASRSEAFFLRLFEQPSFDFLSADSSGATPLGIAAEAGNLVFARIALERGASPESARPDIKPPLHSAIRRGDLPMARLLLEGKSPLFWPDASGRRLGALLELVHASRTEAWGMETLRARCVACSAPERSSLRPALPPASKNFSRKACPHAPARPERQLEMAQMLMDFGAPLRSLDERDGKASLSAHCVLCDQTALLSFFAQQGLDVSEASPLTGLAPIHLAARDGKLGPLALLISLGADLVAKTPEGRTAAELAHECAHPRAASLIEEALLEISLRGAFPDADRSRL